MTAENHIRNPFELFLQQLADAALSAGDTLRSQFRPRAARQAPAIRKIGVHDLRDALARGVGDFGAYRTDVLFVCLVYPIAGLVLARVAYGFDMLPLVFPLASGFALIGPVAAVGLYEISRRREQGAHITWADAFGVVRSPAFGSVAILGLVLVAVFLLWLAAAYVIYLITLGPAPPTSVASFAHDVFETGPGWAMIGAGMGVGLLFAVLAFAISVVSFPLLLDRNVGVGMAIATSVRAVVANPGPMALWGLIVAGGLLIGSAPGLIGLIIVMPVLGHATWHLYRKVTAPA